MRTPTIRIALCAMLLMSSCTWNFSRSYWNESQANFRRVNADNQVYTAWLHHTTYPGTSVEDYCRKIDSMPDRGELSNYGSITEECRVGLYDSQIEGLKKRLKEIDGALAAEEHAKEGK